MPAISYFIYGTLDYRLGSIYPNAGNNLFMKLELPLVVFVLIFVLR